MLQVTREDKADSLNSYSSTTDSSPILRGRTPAAAHGHEHPPQCERGFVINLYFQIFNSSCIHSKEKLYWVRELYLKLVTHSIAAMWLMSSTRTPHTRHQTLMLLLCRDPKVLGPQTDGLQLFRGDVMHSPSTSFCCSSWDLHVLPDLQRVSGLQGY